jgi:hypothetical protein
MSHKLHLQLAVLAIGLATHLSASAINVNNAGFETDVLTCAAGVNCATDDSVSVWTASTADPKGFADGVNGAGSFGVFKPGPLQYPSGIPGGSNVGYLYGTTYSPSFSQVLSATLLANDTYTLTVWFGQRVDTNNGCNGSNVALEAGGVVLNSLAQDTVNTCPAVRGVFQEVTVSYTTGANPARLGDPLEIVLTANGSGSQFETSEIDFDNVALSDTRSSVASTPEPASMAMLGLGLIGLAALRPRRARKS